MLRRPVSFFVGYPAHGVESRKVMLDCRGPRLQSNAGGFLRTRVLYRPETYRIQQAVIAVEIPDFKQILVCSNWLLSGMTARVYICVAAHLPISSLPHLLI